MYDLDNLDTFHNLYVDFVRAMNKYDVDTGSHADSGHIMNTSNFMCFISSLNSKDSSKLWYMRLGHPCTNLLHNFLRLHNLPTKHVSFDCAMCAIQNSKTLPHSTFRTAYSLSLELLQIDLWGPSPFFFVDTSPYTSSNNNYFLSVVDAYNKYN